MWQVIGQDRILTPLKRSFEEGYISHAYLLTGPTHVGKKTLALNIAQSLNCSAPEAPCGHCHSCLTIAAGKHADVVFFDLTTRLDLSASPKQNARVEISIDDMKELHHKANLPPYEGKYKIFIVDNAEFLSTEAANSILKILEEPPRYIVWILLANEENRVLPTIVSRCQRLELKPMPPGQIQRVLTTNYNVATGEAALLDRLSHGCFGWALSALSDKTLLEHRSARISQLSPLLTVDLNQRFSYAQEVALLFSHNHRSTAGTETIMTWLDWWRDLLLTKSNCKNYITNIDYEESIEKQAAALSLAEIKDFLTNLLSVEKEIHKNVNPRLALEWLMLNLPRKEITDD
jgi:DNA polymerase III subunit delta'